MEKLWKHSFHHSGPKCWKNTVGKWEAAEMSNHFSPSRWKKRTRKKKGTTTIKREVAIAEPHQIRNWQPNKIIAATDEAQHFNTAPANSFELAFCIKVIMKYGATCLCLLNDCPYCLAPRVSTHVWASGCRPTVHHNIFCAIPVDDLITLVCWTRFRHQWATPDS